MSDELRDQIDSVLAAIEGRTSGRPRFITLYIYGNARNLAAVSKLVKRQFANALVEHGDGSLEIIDAVAPEREAVYRLVSAYRDIAESQGAEFDGFEFNLDDDANESFVPAFDTQHAVNTVFCWPLKAKGYGCGVFVGGDEKSGFLFDFHSQIIDAPVAPSGAQWTSLYRQPIFCVIDPSKVQAVGSIDFGDCYLGRQYGFRIMTGGEGFDDALARVAPGTDVGRLSREEYVDFLASLAASGKRVELDDWGLVTASVQKRGKLRLTEEYDVRDSRLLASSYVLGVYGTLEMVESSLTGEGRDLVVLNDKVFVPRKAR